jgi:hypothetical protein
VELSFANETSGKVRVEIEKDLRKVKVDKAEGSLRTCTQQAFNRPTESARLYEHAHEGTR